MNRIQLTDAHILTAMEALTRSIGKRIEKHGRNAYTSMHEARGVMQEEIKELDDALHADSEQEFAKEIIQMAVVSVIAVASMVAGSELVKKATSSESVEFREELDETNEVTMSSEYHDLEAARDRARQLMEARSEALKQK